MIDTHAHINTDKFDEDIDLVIENAKKAGLEHIIIPGIEVAEFGSIIDLVDKYPDYLYCGIGIHPHSAKEINDEVLDKIESLASHNNVVAIGEMGLDYYYDFNPKDIQKVAFIKQIQLSKKLNLPIIVHNRESDEDLLNILDNEQDGKLHGVIHCFSSDMETLNRAIKIGMHISFTGNITFKKYDDHKIVENTPMDRIMLETDSPYMTPVPYRGKRNEPKHVKYVAEKIAEIKKISLEEVISMTSQNAKKLFKIPLFIFLLLSINLIAYSQENEEEESEDDKKYSETSYLDENDDSNNFVIIENPFNKTLGIGVSAGTNVIIKNNYVDGGVQEESQKSIPLFGANFNYHLLDFINLQFAYVYSKNQNVVDKVKQDFPEISDSLLPAPNIHQLFELSASFIARSSSNMNFYGNIGTNLFYNNINGVSNSQFGIVFGIGLQYNILFENYGTLTIATEMKFDFELSKTTSTFIQTKYIEGTNNPREFETKEITETFRHQFTTPRLTIIYYPNLW